MGILCIEFQNWTEGKGSRTTPHSASWNERRVGRCPPPIVRTSWRWRAAAFELGRNRLRPREPFGSPRGGWARAVARALRRSLRADRGGHATPSRKRVARARRGSVWVCGHRRLHLPPRGRGWPPGALCRGFRVIVENDRPDRTNPDEVPGPSRDGRCERTSRQQRRARNRPELTRKLVAAPPSPGPLPL
jgi:hypothetical protein